MLDKKSKKMCCYFVLWFISQLDDLDKISYSFDSEYYVLEVTKFNGKQFLYHKFYLESSEDYDLGYLVRCISEFNDWKV